MCTYIQSCTCNVILVGNVVHQCTIMCNNVAWWRYIEVARLVQWCYNVISMYKDVSCNVTMSQNNVHRCVHVSSWCYNNVTMLHNDIQQCVTVSDKLCYMFRCYNNTSWCVTIDSFVTIMCNLCNQSVTMLHQCYDSVEQYVSVFLSYAMLTDNIPST